MSIIQMLSHSYVIHPLEYATAIRYIKKLLGHNSLKITRPGTHVSTRKMTHIQSPLDRLKRR